MRASKKAVAKAWKQLGEYFREGMEEREKEEEEERQKHGGE
jgi:TRAP-type C4-dicarboxylate transport system substrate-binding protein